MISDTAVVCATDQQVSSEVEGETIILDLLGGTYFGLDAVGARVWELIQEPKSVDDVLDILLNEYEVDKERCREDLVTLLQDLEKHDLVEIKDSQE